MTFKGGYTVKCNECGTVGWKKYNIQFKCKKCGGDDFDIVHEEGKSLGKTRVGG